MKKLKFGVFLILSIAVMSTHAQKSLNVSKMNSFVSNLIQKMTLEEKIGQLNLPSPGYFTTDSTAFQLGANNIKNGNIGGVYNIRSIERIKEIQRIAVEESRLKIPLIFGMDVIHGYKTIFPIPIALSCTWDMDLIEKSARIAAVEASAEGVNWTFSPMIDVSRDARWGRISEGNGEDPFLGALIAKSMIKGYQGSLTKNNEIMACAKHFALYGASESGLDYNTVDMSLNRMYNDFFPPFKAAVEAGVGSFMTAFNEINGVPATANKWLLTDVLRKQWGFDGFVVSDCNAINEMIEHGIGDLQTVSALAIKAGTDMDMVGQGFLSTLKKSLEEKKITLAEIDNACRLVLEAKYKLGLFENPYKYIDLNRAKNEVFTDENRKVAREIASNSFVLLKNDGILPLKNKTKIALIGPLADAKNNMAGTWSIGADQEKSISVLKGLKDVFGNSAEILYAKGSNLLADSIQEVRATVTEFDKSLNWDSRPASEISKEALKIAEQSDVIIAALGEGAEMNGESSSRVNLGIPNVQKELLEKLVKTGKPIVLLLFTGRPLTLGWENENVSAILNVWFGGSETGYAIADVLKGDVNPSAKLTITFPQHVGQLPLYYAKKSSGRPLNTEWFSKFRTNFFDVSNEPVFPFGFGLSYTTFNYSDINLSHTSLKGNQKLMASVTITNTGNYDGAEIAQLYIQDLVGSITRPVKELKGFKKIWLKSGESKKVEFEISPEELKFYNNDLIYDWEPGEFNIMIGSNSKDVNVKKFSWIK